MFLLLYKITQLYYVSWFLVFLQITDPRNNAKTSVTLLSNIFFSSEINKVFKQVVKPHNVPVLTLDLLQPDNRAC